jgi:hypothetical protein
MSNDEQPEVREVREQLRKRVDGEIHGIQEMETTNRDAYFLIHRTTTADEIPNGPDSSFTVLDRRTVAADLDTGEITVTDNGLWTLPDTEILESEKTQLCRSMTDTTHPNNWDPVETAGKPPEPKALNAVVPVNDPTDSGQNIERMERDPGISPQREWGYGGGPPPEVSEIAERINSLGLDPSDHFIRLLWGAKEPFDSPRESVPVEDLVGNYGIEVNERDVGLVAVDVDYPDKFDADLPDTLEVSSPHGTDRQRHLLFYCENKTEISDALGGAWASQVPDWGELWVGSRYLVGPGCELSQYGCSEGEHESGERGGCSRCSTPGDGTYEILNDPPIATVEPDRIISELLVTGDKSVTVTAESDPFDRGNDTDGEEEQTHKNTLAETDEFCRCEKCLEVIPTEEAFVTRKNGKEITVCKGGC